MEDSLMSDQKIYALKVDDEHAEMVHAALCEGEGRFGWSYVEGADLRELRRRIEQSGWDSLLKDEKDCYQNFLFNLQPDDYVVYINVPTRGHCTLARVTKPYYWRWADDDFNHRFGVNPASVQSFNRNDDVVHPALSARLKLQSRWWRIYMKEEFESLLENLKAGNAGKPFSAQQNLQQLSLEIKPLLVEITKRIQHRHPNSALEPLIFEVLKAVPGVKEVEHRGGAGDKGADIVAVLERSHPLTGDLEQTTYVVQVKSFVGEHCDTQAVRDIRRAFDAYPDAQAGLVVSTAERSSTKLDKAIEELRVETGKEVTLLIGDDVARFILRYGSHLIA
jgi:hypothetical protein